MTTTQTFTEETTSVAGLAIRVLVGGEGPHLLWLHHSTGSLGWLPLHEKLSEKFRVVVPDEDADGEAMGAWRKRGPTADLVERLMGRKPELRLAFIQENAARIDDLDI